MEMSVSPLVRMTQASDESPMDYLTRFKSVRNWCRMPLPEVEFVRLALNDLDVEYKKKFLGANFRDMYELAQHVEQYDHLLRDEKISKPPSQWTIYKNPKVSYASIECDESQYIDKGKLKFPEKRMTVDTDPFHSVTVGLVDARLPKSKGKENVEFAPVQHILKQSSQPRLKIDLFSNAPPTELSGPAIVEPMSNYNDEENGGPIVSHILKKGSQPRLKIDLFSNAPPTKLSELAIVVFMSDSSDDENGGPIVLCRNCKACVVLTEPKRQLPPMQMPTPQHQSAITVKLSNEPSKGQRQKVFDMLDPRKQTDGPTLVRPCFDFDAPFYEDDYSRNSSSLSLSANPKTFGLPKPRDQRWYSYNSPTGMYTALSKSQKR
ncbi:hypothetical protein ACFX1Q_030603 [Malus domestica]